jgi:hypothetical protein
LEPPKSIETDVSKYLDSQAGEDLNITVSAASTQLNSETTSFTDQNPSYSYVVDSEPDPTFGAADMDDVSLAKFLSRPV